MNGFKFLVIVSMVHKIPVAFSLNHQNKKFPFVMETK